MLKYRNDLPKKEDIFRLYEALGWNEQLNLTSQELLFAMKGSFFGVYVYDDERLIGTGRLISDGVTNAYMCGVGVLPEYQNHGIGREIINKIASFSHEHSLHMQIICDKELVSFYEKLGFNSFGIAMKN